MTNFSTQDIEQITSHGLTPDTVNTQIQNFISGFPYSDITSPAYDGNGILVLTDEQHEKYISIYDTNCNQYSITKFVPASGAATRMFQDLFTYLSSGESNDKTQTVLDNIEQFAFWDDLQQLLPQNATDADKIKYLITDAGLNYGSLPKALLKFHKYANGESRTALAEHLIEGALYAQSNHTVNMHFTVSPEHITAFQTHLAQILPIYGTRFNTKYNISMSTQRPQTDTIAVNMDNTPFRNPDGTLLFRPAGHGALIENLNDLTSQIIFIKNIDNVCTDKMRSDTVHYKKLLGGILIDTQRQVFDYLHQIDNGTANISEITEFIGNTLGYRFANTPDLSTLHKILNRPIRACGIIRNTGAPGGGPFWVRTPTGDTSLQIVEPGQISPDNISILHNGKYFSPTDIACGIFDYRGNKFNLLHHIDETAGFISTKSKNGVPLRAMERPGLWNGAMSDWNTIFVETPNTTFTPVKTIIDLITPDHTTK